MTTEQTFTITPKILDLIFESDGSDTVVKCSAGVATPVSERQAVHALGRTDVTVGLPDGYADQLAALAGTAVDVEAMTVAELDALAAELDVPDWGGVKADKIAALRAHLDR